MKILSWNIWQGMHFENVVKELQEPNADIICLQEVKKDSKNQAEKIAQELGYHVAHQEVFRTDRHTPSFTLCNAILAKREIVDVQREILSGLEKYEGTAATEPRGALKGKVNGITIICTHLGFSSDLSVTKLQQEQLNNLLSIIDQEKCVLAGDFNSVPDSEIIKKIEKKMVNTDASNTPTRNARKKGENTARIDYIFVTNGIQCKNFQIHHTEASDHNILTVEIEHVRSQ